MFIIFLMMELSGVMLTDIYLLARVVMDTFYSTRKLFCSHIHSSNDRFQAHPCIT